MWRAFFTIMVASWAPVVALGVFSPSTLEDIWTWARGAPWYVETSLSIVFPPWGTDVAVTQSGRWLRWCLIIGILAVGRSAASRLRQRPLGDIPSDRGPAWGRLPAR